MPIHRRYPYQRALDGRKQPVRGLWVRNDLYYAQIRIALDSRSAPRRVLLTNSDSSPCSTVAEAKQAMERFRVQRADDNLPTLKQAPPLAEYVEKIPRRRNAPERIGNCPLGKALLRLMVPTRLGAQGAQSVP